MERGTQLLVDIVPGIIVGLVSSVISSFLAAYLTLRGHYSHQWWQLKSKSYSDILLALYNMRDYYQTHLSEFENGNELSEQEMLELNKMLLLRFATNEF